MDGWVDGRTDGWLDKWIMWPGINFPYQTVSNLNQPGSLWGGEIRNTADSFGELERTWREAHKPSSLREEIKHLVLV